MQVCKKCKATWSIATQLEVCPFCGNQLLEKKRIENIEEAFRIIVEQHGRNVFINGKQFIGLLGDYARAPCGARF